MKVKGNVIFVKGKINQENNRNKSHKLTRGQLLQKETPSLQQPNKEHYDKADFPFQRNQRCSKMHYKNRLKNTEVSNLLWGGGKELGFT